QGNWYDWWTGKKYSGKSYINVVSPLDTMPIFAREGAIIPSQPEMQYVGEKEVKEITLDIYPAANSSFSLYEDDGESLDYLQNNFSITKIDVSQTAGQTQVKIASPVGMYKPSKH